MAYIEIFPKSAAAQAQLTECCAQLMDMLQGAVRSVFKLPEHDIIIELDQCKVLAFNASAVRAAAVPDVVIKVSTSDVELRPEFQALCDQIVSGWNAQFGDSLGVEVWVSVIEAWGCNLSFD
nr:hypothetical protein [uncultured Pseudomonas sp.]